MRSVKIMRGIPGSGKSTLAKQLAFEAADRSELPIICSADDYFIGQDGVYHFELNKLGDAHRECMRKFIQCIQDKMSPIFVDNTNVNIEDISPYIAVGEALGYDVEVVQVNTPLEVALGRNVHGVGDAQVTSMYKRMLNTRLPFRFKVKNVP